MDNASGDTGWVSLRTPRTELVLNHTLPTGQSFRWRLNTDGDYVGVIGKRVVSMRQATDDVLYRVHCRPNGEDATRVTGLRAIHALAASCAASSMAPNVSLVLRSSIAASRSTNHGSVHRFQ